MKKILFITLFTIGSIAVSAQSNQSNGIEQRVEKAKVELDLNSTQVESWKAIYEKYDLKMNAALRTRDRNRLQRLSSQKQVELKETLSEDQKVKYDAWVSSKKQ